MILQAIGTIGTGSVHNNNDHVTTENLDAALKEFFEGRRGAVAIRYSDANQQLLKSLLTEKYSGKTILYMK